VTSDLVKSNTRLQTVNPPRAFQRTFRTFGAPNPLRIIHCTCFPVTWHGLQGTERQRAQKEASRKVKEEAKAAQAKAKEKAKATSE
jgi:hypothetical protein